MKMKMKKITYLLLLIIAVGCKDDYDLPVTVPATGYLVVDGTINSGTGRTVINLSKTVRLIDTFSINYVKDATVNLEGEDNSVSPLYFSGSGGEYVNDQLSLNPSSKYRLRIQSPDGKEYLSDFLVVNQSPAIDAIVWERDEAGVGIYANAHGNSGTSGYYRWDYDETWEYHSAYVPTLKLNSVPLAEWIFPSHSGDESKFVCYSNARSTTIEILSTAKLSVDTVHYRVITLLNRERKLSVLYSCNIRQFAISRECFEYLQRMKKNTEQTGSIFDSQPSELRGNITCVTNPQEPVIGFLQIAPVYSQRIFISNAQVPAWGYLQGCSEMSVVNHKDSIGFGAPTNPDVLSPRGDIVRLFMASPDCVDCTLRGGTLLKPTFWP